MTFSKNVHSIKHDLQAVIISLQCPTSSDVKHLKRVFRRLTGAWSWPWQLLLCSLTGAWSWPWQLLLCSLAPGLGLDNCCYISLAPGLGLDNCCYAHWYLVLALTTVAMLTVELLMHHVMWVFSNTFVQQAIVTTFTLMSNWTIKLKNMLSI